jgi:hypothetical protein
VLDDGLAIEQSGELVEAHALAAAGGDEDGGNFRFQDCELNLKSWRSAKEKAPPVK